MSRWSWASLLLAIASVACASDPGGEDGAAGGGGGGGSDEGVQPVAIRFVPQLFGGPLDCEMRLVDLGVEPVDAGLRDLRFYVHAVELLRADGTSAAVTLDEDGVHQARGVALVDLEDGKGTCAHGDAEVHDVVTGTVPAGSYVGLRFTLGVPFEDNHIDVTTATPPLDDTSMFWGWGEGRIFLSAITSREKDDGLLDLFAFQMASTGCEGDPRYGEVVACSHPNRPVFTFEAFDPATQAIAADLGELFVDSPLVTGASCMGSSTEPSCQPLFEHVGLEALTGAATPETQTFLRVVAP